MPTLVKNMPSFRALLMLMFFLSVQARGQVLFHGTAEKGDLTDFYAPSTTWGCTPKCNGGGLFDGSQPSPHPPYNGTVHDYQCFEKPEHTHVQTTMTAVLASSEGIPEHSGSYVIKAVHHSYCKNDVHDAKGTGGPGCSIGQPGCKCTPTTESSTGTRMFRWSESADPKYFDSGLYYGIWMYFPQNFGMTHQTSNGRFFNLVQFKAVTAAKGKEANDPVWSIDVANQTPGSVSPMRMELSFNGHWFPGPRMNSAQPTQRFASASQANLTIPTGKWFHVQIYLKQWPREAKPYRGRIAVWQDGVLLHDLGGPDDPDGIWTKYGDDIDGTKKDNGITHFAFNNYTDGVIPDPAVIYFDDVVISTAPIYPGTALTQRSKK